MKNMIFKIIFFAFKIREPKFWVYNFLNHLNDLFLPSN